MSETIAPGYRRRPAWTYALAVAFLLAPLGSLWIELAAAGLASPRLAGAWGAWLSLVPLVSWIILGAVFLSGLGLLFVTSATLHLAMGTLGLVLAHNVFLWTRAPEGAGMRLLLFVGLTSLVIFLFWLSDLRRPYLEPRLRWWETAPRFRVELPVEVGGRDTRLLDISRTGALVEGVLPDELGADVCVKFPQGFELPAKIVRVAMGGATGLHFAGGDWASRSKLRSYLRALKRDPRAVGR